MKAKVLRTHKSQNVATASPTSQFHLTCESHSRLRSQLKCLFFRGPLPDSLRLSEVPIHGLHHLVIWKKYIVQFDV